MSRHSDTDSRTAPPGPPGFWGTLWRLSIVGAFLFGAGGLAGYAVVQHLVRTPEVQAPDLLTMKLDEAVQAASREGFATRVGSTEPNEVLGHGQILAQRPQGGDWVKRGATIVLTVTE